jgi:hypothetical protein
MTEKTTDFPPVPFIYCVNINVFPFARRKIRLVEGSAECHLKKLTCKGTLRQVFYKIYLSEVPSHGPIFLPLTHYICIQYTYSHGGANQREG